MRVVLLATQRGEGGRRADLKSGVDVMKGTITTLKEKTMGSNKNPAESGGREPGLKSMGKVRSRRRGGQGKKLRQPSLRLGKGGSWQVLGGTEPPLGVSRWQNRCVAPRKAGSE